MLSAFSNSLKIPELRQRIFFTLLMIVVVMLVFRMLVMIVVIVFVFGMLVVVVVIMLVLGMLFMSMIIIVSMFFRIFVTMLVKRTTFPEFELYQIMGINEFDGFCLGCNRFEWLFQKGF